VRFVVDENLSPLLCRYLSAEGDTAEHVHHVIGAGARDEEIFAYATREAAVVVTADTDFGALLARFKTDKPSVILMRELLSLSVDSQGRLLAANLDQIRLALTNGAIVVFSLDDLRVRSLPIGR
jgi:predicted nuclease of predicted toxin-antitoxin system